MVGGQDRQGFAYNKCRVFMAFREPSQGLRRNRVATQHCRRDRPVKNEKAGLN